MVEQSLGHQLCSLKTEGIRQTSALAHVLKRIQCLLEEAFVRRWIRIMCPLQLLLPLRIPESETNERWADFPVCSNRARLGESPLDCALVDWKKIEARSEFRQQL